MWPHEKTLSLIKDYRNAECLWNVANTDYKNHDKKDYALQCIANKHKISVQTVNRKVAALKFQLRRQYRKLVMFKKSGTLLKATWFAYEPLSFLLPYIEASEKACTSDDELLTVNDEIVEINVEKEHSTRSTPRSREKPLEETETSVRPRGLRESNVVNEKKRSRSMDKETEAVVHLETFTEPTTKRDDFSIYGELIASKFRSSGRNNKEIAIAQYHIEQICFNLVMGIYGNEYKRFHESQSSTPRPTSSNSDDITIQEANSQLGTWMETLKHES